MKHRWPKSLHCQAEAAFHSVRAFRTVKEDSMYGVRSLGSWKVYKYESHRFIEHCMKLGIKDLLDTAAVKNAMADYLKYLLISYTENKRSRQTFETILAALGKFEHATNSYIESRELSVPLLDVRQLRMDFYVLSKKQLKKSSKVFNIRAFPDPSRLIDAIKNETHKLQATLQYEGGLRAEGAGAPGNRLRNPITKLALKGFCKDPVSGKAAGLIATKEKGGKITDHYISVQTYQQLENFLQLYDKLESDYPSYVNSLNQAAKETGQYEPGRGTHALKHNFSEERYLECVSQGFSHEQALQQVSVETSHFRLNETLTYTRG